VHLFSLAQNIFPPSHPSLKPSDPHLRLACKSILTISSFYIVYENKLYSNYFNKLNTKRDSKGGQLNGRQKPGHALAWRQGWLFFW
jgi:hypothetical protein